MMNGGRGVFEGRMKGRSRSTSLIRALHYDLELSINAVSMSRVIQPSTTVLKRGFEYRVEMFHKKKLH